MFGEILFTQGVSKIQVYFPHEDIVITANIIKRLLWTGKLRNIDCLCIRDPIRVDLSDLSIVNAFCKTVSMLVKEKKRWQYRSPEEIPAQI